MFRDPDPDFPGGGPEPRYSETNPRIKQTFDLQQVRSHSWIDGDLQEVNPLDLHEVNPLDLQEVNPLDLQEVNSHDLDEVKPHSWIDGAAFHKILDTRQNIYIKSSS